VYSLYFLAQMSMGPSKSMMFPRFSWGAMLSAWSWSPFSMFILVLVVLVGIWYLKSVRELRTRGIHWKTSRTVNFLIGLLTVDIALQSPIATLAGSSFSVHVTQHMILMALSPLLLALGAPSTLLLQTSSRKTKSRWLSVLHSKPFLIIKNEKERRSKGEEEKKKRKKKKDK